MPTTKKVDLHAVRRMMISKEGSMYAWCKNYGWRTATIWEWENGKKPSIDTMKRFARDLYGSSDNWVMIAKYF